MLTRLRIRNFKAWQDTGDIRLAPLTVFFGTNSSGKTSLLQFLLMLKQTVQSPDRRRVLHFGDSRSLVDLGVWPEMVFRHTPDRTLGFKLDWSSSNSGTYTIGDGAETEEFDESLSFEAEVGTGPQEHSPLNLKSFSYRAQDGDFIGFRYVDSKHYAVSLSGTTNSASHIPAESSHFHSLTYSSHGLPGAAWREIANQQYFFQVLLEQQLASIRYLGPLRQSPSRLYPWAGDTPEEVGLGGERTIEALLASQNKRQFKPGATQQEGSTPFEVLVSQWLQRMGILDSVEIKPIAPHRKEYEVLVKAVGTPDAVSLTDVGFGVSQVLPVLVQLLYVGRKSTLIFEQPELHLHPRAQSALADVFIEALRLREGEESRDIQLLVESHSEHFLRRIQRRIAEEKLNPADVALYFCKPGHEGSTLEELKLDEYGNISNWPENFFGDEVGDLAAMTEAAMKRQLGSAGE